MSLYLGDTPIAVNSSSREIGEIIQSTIPLSDAGLHLLDGALINGAGSYSAFVTYIAGLVSSYPDLFTTEANWQSSVSTYGVCGKFVYDSVNNTVRLPKYSNKIYTGGGTAPVVGNGMTLGLTNGTNLMGLTGTDTYRGQIASTELKPYANAYGQPISNSNQGPTNSYTKKGYYGITTDPEKSGIIAQLSDITTSLDGYYYIVIANSVKTNIEVDIDEIATDLNGKADVDLSNLSVGLSNTICTTKATTTSTASSARPAVIKENYVNGTEWYRVWSDGWIEQGGVIALHPSGYGQKTVNFLKPMSNTNYTYQFSISYNNTGTVSYRQASLWSKSTTGFICYDDDVVEKSWYVCGY